MKILVIRRDNIGDLVCTTPLLMALRGRHPDAWIGVLTNSYCAPVLAGHPAIDEVFVYRKAKHREPGQSLPAAYLERLAMIWRLRRLAVDRVILAAPARQASAERFARWVAPKAVVGGRDGPGRHEAEKVFAVAREFDIAGPPPACLIEADAHQIEHTRDSLLPALRGRPLIGLHISARKPSQRWPAERFATLARSLHERWRAGLLLFWSPGPADHPQHPGDDDKAAAIVSACHDLPLQPMPTARLDQLMTGLSLTDAVICADGGAMHVAAGLGRPIVCLFGDSSAERWHPWGVPFELLQKPSRQVLDIPVDDVLAAWERLSGKPQWASSQLTPTPTSTNNGTAS